MKWYHSGLVLQLLSELDHLLSQGLQQRLQLLPLQAESGHLRHQSVHLLPTADGALAVPL